MRSWIRAALLPMVLCAAVMNTACSQNGKTVENRSSDVEMTSGADAERSDGGKQPGNGAEQPGDGTEQLGDGAKLPRDRMEQPGTEGKLPEEETELSGEEQEQTAEGKKMTSDARDADAHSGSRSRTEIQIQLPRNEKWYSGPVYSTEEGNVEQVMFRDEITGSDAIVRACREEDGDPSVFYYMFDDSKKQAWTVSTEDGTRIDITVEVTVENSDIRGVLATWNRQGILYALWEDDAVHSVDSVAKIAMEIAERSR